jgi:hypothetical protein
MLVSAQSCARFDNFLVDEFVSNPINMIWITPKKATLSLSLSRFLVDEFVSKPIYSFKTILCSL